MSNLSVNLDKMHLVSDFLKSFGLKTFETHAGEDYVVEVLDTRAESWKLSYNFSVDKDGKTMKILGIGLTTPIVLFSYTDTLDLVVMEEEIGKDSARIKLYNVKPLTVFLDSYTLKMLVENPAYFLVSVALTGRFEICGKFVEWLEDTLNKEKVTLPEEKQKQLDELVAKVLQ